MYVVADTCTLVHVRIPLCKRLARHNTTGQRTPLTRAFPAKKTTNRISSLLLGLDSRRMKSIHTLLLTLWYILGSKLSVG